MAEASEDKTIRKYLHALTSNEWTYRHSVFYDDHNESVHLLDDMIVFKQTLRRKHPEQPFLIRIQLLNREKRPQAYLMIMTTKRVRDIQDIADKSFSAPPNTVGEPVNPKKLESIAGKIRTQKPHDLQWFFKKPQVRRWTILNKEKLLPAQS
ncbi:hypothetical protein O203_23915 [Ectopseudomonas chengduensis]|nr:hypothetical protein O203_23915 [Pseudomonas chengduensis]